MRRWGSGSGTLRLLTLLGDRGGEIGGEGVTDPNMSWESYTIRKKSSACGQLDYGNVAQKKLVFFGWNLCTLYLLACQMKPTVGDLDLCDVFRALLYSFYSLDFFLPFFLLFFFFSSFFSFSDSPFFFFFFCLFEFL